MKKISKKSKCTFIQPKKMENRSKEEVSNKIIESPLFRRSENKKESQIGKTFK